LEEPCGASTSRVTRPEWPGPRRFWEKILRFSRRPPRSLRLRESLPLGDRRFVAVVEFEQSRFLVGGTSASLVLLARLENSGLETSTRNHADPTAAAVAATNARPL